MLGLGLNNVIPMDVDGPIRVDTDTNLVATNVNDNDLDVLANHDGFTNASTKNQHATLPLVLKNRTFKTFEAIGIEPTHATFPQTLLKWPLYQ